MIVFNKLFVPELKTKFTVINVKHEPHAESEWLLKYQDLEPFYANEQLFETTKDDELLVGKEIEAQINVYLIPLQEPIINSKKEKTMSFSGNIITATGIYVDKMDTYVESELYEYLMIDSLFKFKVPADKFKNLKLGDSVTIEGEAVLILPRGTNIG